MRIQKAKPLNQRIMAFLLVAIMMLSLVPADFIMTAKAAGADTMPMLVTDFDPAGELKYYSETLDMKTSGTGNVTMRKIDATLDGKPTYALCYDYGSGLTQGIQKYDLIDDNFQMGFGAPFVAFFYDMQEQGIFSGPDGDWYLRVYSALAQLGSWYDAIYTGADLQNEEKLVEIATDYKNILCANDADGWSVYEDDDHGLLQSTMYYTKHIIDWWDTNKDEWTFYLYGAIDSAGNIIPNTTHQRMLLALSEGVTDEPVYVSATKFDDKNTGLAGAKFGVFTDAACTNKITEMESKSNGVATSEKLENLTLPVTLYIKEISPPPGDYTLSTEVKSVTVTDANTTVATAASAGTYINALTVINTGSSLLRKVDADTNQGLPGATFTFVGTTQMPDGNYYNGSFTTESGGYIPELQWHDPNAEGYIPPGVYTVTEKVPPSGYELNTTSQTLTLYATWNWNGGHGPDSTHDLTEGQTCTQPPLDGTASNSCGEYTFTSSGMLTFKNYKQHTVELLKIDASGRGLPNARFDIYLNSTLLHSNYPTDNAGRIILTEVESGTYRFVEKEPPAGYLLPKVTSHSIYVDATQTTVKTHTITITNYEYDSIKIRKVDNNGNYLANAEFEIYIDGEQLGGTYFTNQAGFIVIDYATYGEFLPQGKDSWTITVKEINPPYGYDIANPVTQFYEMHQGVYYNELVFTNNKQAELIIYKDDIQNPGNYLPGTTFEVTDPNGVMRAYETDDDGKISINPAIPGMWSIKETIPPPGYHLNPGDNTKTILVESGKQAVYTVTFRNYDYDTIRIYKTDDQGNPLAGASFKITIDGTTFGTLTTDDDGEILIDYDGYKNFLTEHKDSWTIRVEEVTPPSGYLLATPYWQENELHMGQELSPFVFVNTQYPVIYLIKEDADTCEPLDNALFQLDIEGYQFGTFITDENGEIVIRYNDYVDSKGNTVPGYGRFLNDLNMLDKTDWQITFTELQAPGNYLLPIDKSQTNTLVLGQARSTFSFYNSIYPEIYLAKTDATTNEALPGAHFDVNIEGYHFGSFVTDENGKIIIRFNDTLAEDGSVLVKGYGHFLDDLNLPGKTNWQVTFTETQAPRGYLIAEPASQTNTLVYGQNTCTFAFANAQYPEVVIRKYDSNDNKPLAGASFDIKFDGNLLPGSFVTDETGTIRITHKEYGTFLDDLNNPEDHTWTVTVEETSAPANYFLSGKLTKNIQTGSLKLGIALQEFAFKNEPFPDVHIYKEDTKLSGPLEGVTYELYNENGPTNLTATTDSDGWAIFENVPEGTYTLREVDVPSGYVLSERTYVVISQPSSDGHKQILKYFYGNDQAPTLTIIKVDSITGERLPNVKLNIKYKADGLPGTEVNLGDFMTDENGEVNFTQEDNLPLGWYTVYEPSPPTGYQYHKTDGDTTTFHLQGNEEYTHTIRNTPKSTLVIHKTDSATGLPVSGATFEVRYLGTTSGGSGTLIKTDITSINGTITITGLEAGTYVIEETRSPNGYEKSSPSQQTVYINGDEQDVIEVWFTNAKKGSLSILKLDSVTNQPLAGASFKITDSSGTPVGASNGMFVSDASGMIQIDEMLTIGETITVQEIKAPDGYVLDSTPQNIKIKENTAHSLTFYNQPKGSLIIIKRDTVTGEVLPGAEFEIKNSAGEYTAQSGGAISSNGRYTTDKNGMIHITDLPEDTYVITEITAPKGYNRDTTPQTVKVNPNDTQTLTFWNSPQSAIQIVKRDADTKEPIKGVEFQISHKNGQVIGTYTTNADGIIILDGFTPGWYTAIETKAAEGYVLDAAPRDFEITNNQFAQIVFDNVKQPGLQILKIDADTGKSIPNVTFEIRSMNQALIGTYKTDSKGVIFVPGLEAGYYTVIETKAADGYIADDTPRTVEVKDGKTALLTVENKAGSGILIYKIDSVTKEGLPGAEFMLMDSNHKAIGTYKSDDKGRVWVDDVDLTDSKYFLREIKAPNGYMLDEQERTLYLVKGSTTTITWENTARLGQIQVQKLSADYNDTNGLAANSPLSGATFGIYSYRSGALIGTMTTGANGWAISKPLPLGQYVIKEEQAPAFYAKSKEEIIVTIEYENQIIKEKFYNFSANLAVTINKTGVKEATAGSNIMYTFKDIRNNSSVPLNDFFWRDTLPTDVVRINYLVTGTYSFNTKYDVYVTTSTGRQFAVAGNMSTQTNNYIDMSANAVGLQTNEYITSFMLVFGQVPAGFRQELDPRIEVKVLNVPNGTVFTNKADVGGTSNGEWIAQNTTWQSTVYNPNTKFPKTGY